MNRPTRTDTVYGNDQAVIWRETDAGYRSVFVSALVDYLNSAVSGADGKSLLNGTTAPGVMDGTEGDFWLDTVTYDIYGPKAGVDWGTPTSLIGPQGDPGVQLVTSVAGMIGAVVLAKGDVGLGNVDNTSDVNKPVSTAQAIAIALKQDTLVSGTNIKTINGTSVLGSGDIVTSVQLSYRHDFNVYDYLGKAASGSSEGASVWTITRLTIASDGTATVGTATNVDWTNRYTHTYS